METIENNFRITGQLFNDEDLKGLDISDFLKLDSEYCSSLSNIAKKIELAYKLFEQKDFTSLYSVISSACSNFELAWETVKKLPNVRYVSTKETLPLYIMKNNTPEDNLLNISVENYSISEMYYL